MKRTIKIVLSSGVISFLFPLAALAHCPLCTAGAGLVAIGAYWIGVKGITIGILLGSFAFALGLWIGKLIKKKIFSWQDVAIAVFSWLTTVFPLKMILSDYTSIYINWGGDYGTIFNSVYPVNMLLIGAIIGALVIYFSPMISKVVTAKRGKTVPFQGIIIVFTSLLVTSLITQFLI